MQEEQPDRFKFVPPSPPFGFMDRPRLSERLASGLSGRLILVQAPAGHGKTGLLASLAAAVSTGSGGLEPSASLAWYQLDQSDDDPAVFLDGLAEAVRGVVPAFGAALHAAMWGVPDPRGEFERLMNVFLEELQSSGPRALWMVLDDFHFITDKVVIEALERILKDPSSPIRLVISTEVEPHFYLSDLRSRDVLVELREGDLRFTPEEVQRLLLDRTGGRLETSVGDSVVKETGGWPSATALAAVIVARSGRRLPFNRLAPTEHGYGQLAGEVLAGLPSELREPLLRSSVLPRVEPAAVASLLGLADPKALFQLAKAVKLPAVMSSGAQMTLRYDPLFRAALVRELTTAVQPDELRSLQRSTASYMANRGRLDEAVRIYREAGAQEEAVALIEEAASDVLDRGHLDTVLRWVRSMSSATRKAHPRLMVLEARALLARGLVDEARALLVTAQPELQLAGDERSMGQRTSSWSRVHLLDGRYQAAKNIAEEAMAQLPQDDFVERSELFWLLASSREMRGELPAAFRDASEGLLLAERSGQQPLVIRALSQLGRLAEQRGDYTKALALTGRAVERSTLLAAEESLIARLGGLAASVHLERDQTDVAVGAADRALDASTRLHDVAGQLRARLALFRAGRRVAQEGSSNLDEMLGVARKLPARQPERALVLQVMAAELLRRGQGKEGAKAAHMALDAAIATTHAPLIEQCRLLVAAPEATGLGVLGPLVRTRQLREALMTIDSRRWLSASQRLLAQGYALLGLRWRARANLEKSLLLAAEEGYVGMPLRLPSRAEALLSFAVRHDVLPELAGALLGVEPGRAAKLLTPLLSSDKSELRSRAERAAKGFEMGLGRVPRPRLPWPGLTDGKGDVEQVALQTLGGISPLVDSKRADWPTSDAKNVAAYFVVNRDTALPRETLLHDVWPNTPPADAHVRLQVALYQMRETLGAGYPHVDLRLESQGAYRWSGDGCLIDVERFRELMRQAEQLLSGETPPLLGEPTVAVLEDAIEVYQGEFLADLNFVWCVEQRETLRAQLLGATRLLMDNYMAMRRWRDAIRHGLKALKSDPLQEDVVRDLMLCYFRTGDRGSVWHQYREVKRLLAKERGAWPSDETRSLRIRLLGK